MNFNQLDSTIETKPEHEGKVNNRKDLEINGVKELDSFDSEEFLMGATTDDVLARGINLLVHNLNVEDGIVHLSGKVHAPTYTDEQREEKAKGLSSTSFRRLCMCT